MRMLMTLVQEIYFFFLCGYRITVDNEDVLVMNLQKLYVWFISFLINLYIHLNINYFFIIFNFKISEVTKDEFIYRCKNKK